MLKTVKEKDSFEALNIFLLSVWALVNAIQMLFVFIYIFRFFPLPDTLSPLLMDFLDPIRLEREMFFYRIFIILVLILSLAGFSLYKKRINQPQLSNQLQKMILADSVSVTAAVFVLLYLLILKLNWRMDYLFLSWMILVLILKCFWRQASEIIMKACRFFAEENTPRFIPGITDYIVALFVVLVLFIPDTKAGIAQIFITDQLYHLDGFLMAPAWSYRIGEIPGVTTASSYGLGMPVFLVHISKIFGPFSYEAVFNAILSMAIFYFIMIYALLRLWLKKPLVCLIGLIWLIKILVFHFGAPTFAWWSMPNTVLRYFFSVFIFIFIFLHIKKTKIIYLVLAGVFTGVGLFYVTDSGVYQMGLYLFYIAVLFFQMYQKNSLQDKRKIFSLVFCLILPFWAAWFLLYTHAGDVIYSPGFWANRFEITDLFMKGFGMLPLGRILNNPADLSYFLLAFCVPLVYLCTVVFIGFFWWTGKTRGEDLFALLLGVYGLAIYHNFIIRSDYYHLFDTCGPLVLILCYWFKEILEILPGFQRKIILAGVFLLAFFSLSTTMAFVEYPGILSLARFNPSLSYKKDILEKNLDLDSDAGLIRQLTKKDEKVCLISSFETALLMQAERKPFFYQFPLIYSSFWGADFTGGTYLVSKKRFISAMSELEVQKPLYIFIEQRFFFRQLSEKFFKKYTTLKALIDYCHLNYEPVEKGKYLLALKRKPVGSP